jgi:Bacterial PH domain
VTGYRAVVTRAAAIPVRVRNATLALDGVGILVPVKQTWVRPYTPGTGRWVVIGWEAVALGLLARSTVALFGFTGSGTGALVVALTLTWTLGVARIVRMGVYVSAGGVRIRGLLRTRTLRWQDVAFVRLHSATHRIGPWEIRSGMTVLIERLDGATVNTELWAQGVDFHRRPGAFRAVYDELRARHLAAAAA